MSNRAAKPDRDAPVSWSRFSRLCATDALSRYGTLGLVQVRAVDTQDPVKAAFLLLLAEMTARRDQAIVINPASLGLNTEQMQTLRYLVDAFRSGDTKTLRDYFGSAVYRLEVEPHVLLASHILFPKLTRVLSWKQSLEQRQEAPVTSPRLNTRLIALSFRQVLINFDLYARRPALLETHYAPLLSSTEFRVLEGLVKGFTRSPLRLALRASSSFPATRPLPDINRFFGGGGAAEEEDPLI